MNSEGSVRVAFDFELGALDQLDQLVEKTHAPKRATVVGNALRVYGQLVNEIDPVRHPWFVFKVEDDQGHLVYTINMKALLLGENDA